MLLAPVLVLLAGVAAAPEPGPAQPLPEARRLFGEGRPEAAVTALVEEFAANPNSSDGTRLLWDVARGAAPRPDLIDAVASAADRLGPDGWLASGVLLRRGFRPLDALAAFERAAVAGARDASRVDIEAGWLLAELRSHELALARFGRHPAVPAAMHGKAVVLARDRQTDQAFDLVDALRRADPANPGAVLLRAELLDSVGRGSEALAALRALADKAGQASPAGFRLARILVQQRRFGEAEPILRAVLAADSGNAEAWHAMARAHQGQDRSGDAVAAFERALEEDPALNEARFGLAQLLTRQGEREAAAPLFAEFERRKAITDESGRLLGEAELRPEDYRRVEAFVTHALANGDFGLALRGAQRFLVEFPEDPERHLLLARVFREGGSRADAERVLQRGLHRFAGNEEAERRFEAGLRAIGAR